MAEGSRHQPAIEKEKRESLTFARPAIRGSGNAHLSRTSKHAEASREYDKS